MRALNLFRETYKIIIILSVIILSSCSTPDRPNVLLIYSDDQGSIDLKCYGAEDLYTPNLDQLAGEGIRFTQFYAGSSVCSPSRAALLTGMSPQAAGLPGNTSSQPGHPGMPGDRITIAEMLKDAGYVTGHIGKWHLGYSDDTRPMAQGFDYTFGHMGGCIDNYSHYFYWNGPNRHDLWENGEEVFRRGEYFPDLMVEKAEEFFKTHRNEPFFLYFAINLPHYPLQPTEKWREYYSDLDMPRRDYAAFVSVVDERVGELIHSLEKLGIRDNTVIIFQSDQGHSCESRAYGGGGNAGPYRGAKSSLFEGGIRIPAILNWPEKFAAGQVNDVACINYDWFPTIAALCGIKSVPEQVEGKSLLSMLDNPDQIHHDVFHWKLGRQWAVRSGDWKLLGNPTDPSGKYPINGEADQLFLVNLKEDVSEKNNLASLYPDKVEELIQLYLQWDFAKKSDIPVLLPPVRNLAQGQSISLDVNPNPKYAGKGAQTLINGKRGSSSFSDGQWLGFEAKDVNCTITLSKAQYINTVTVRALQDAGSWIFLPVSVEIAGGMQKSKTHALGSQKTNETTLKKDFIVKEYKFNIDNKISFLEVSLKALKQCPEWHPGKGGKAWLFIDEIILE